MGRCVPWTTSAKYQRLTHKHSQSRGISALWTPPAVYRCCRTASKGRSPPPSPDSAACSLHRDRKAIFLISTVAVSRKAFRFPPKDEEIALAKFRFVIRIPRLRREIKIPGIRRLLICRSVSEPQILMLTSFQ
jgi:hypothetical protein